MPPVAARLLLIAVADEFTVGDLAEEYAQLCHARGRIAADRWYVRQVIRSVPPLVALRIRSGELARLVVGGLGCVALPLLLLDRLWCFVYSQIPLKDGTDRAPWILAANLLCVCICAAIGGSGTPSPRRATDMALVAAASAGLALCVSTAAAPAAYAISILLAAPASSVVTFAWRRLR